MTDTNDIQATFNAAARDYDSNRRRFIPCFDDFYGGSADLVRRLIRPPRSVFDLGAGTGILSECWLRMYPEAEYVLCDVSPEMLAVARKRFAGRPNVKFFEGDYSKTLPPGTPDAVISALSIHHLEDDDKRSLFRSVGSVLAPGGIFVNHDQFRRTDARIEHAVATEWREHIEGVLSRPDIESWLRRKELDRECTVEEEISWLREAGLRSPNCLFLNGKLAVCAAFSPRC